MTRVAFCAVTNRPVTVSVQLLDPAAALPSYAMPQDAGADLVTTVDVTLPPGGRALVPTGLAIALQELVASLAAWFFIKGVRGFRTGDWIAIGEHYGEVVDISFTHTTMQQCAPASDHSTISGSFTGGLTVLMNNQIFIRNKIF